MTGYRRDIEHICWMANENCDSGWCPQCHSCVVHCEDPQSHDVDSGAGPDREPKDLEISARVKRGLRLERRFKRACEGRSWSVVRGNVLVTYVLRPSWIYDNQERAKLRKVWSALPRTLASDLRKLFRQSGEVSYGGFRIMEVPGLPDFVVRRRTRGAIPFFVEVKYQNTKLSKAQRPLHRRLADLGLEVRVWSGGRLPEAGTP
jgi:hypothetical protein